jgi:hypothetical protein
MIVPKAAWKGKKKVRRMPELEGWDALELMTDDLRLMIQGRDSSLVFRFSCLCGWIFSVCSVTSVAQDRLAGEGTVSRQSPFWRSSAAKAVV